MAANTLSLHTAVKPSATVVVAPQLVAQSALIELSYPELESRIEQELTSNPALEVKDSARRSMYGMTSTSALSAQDHQRAMEETIRANYTLRDDLWWQFHAMAPPQFHAIGQRLIADIDDAGYLKADVFDVADELAVAVEEVFSAVKQLQRLDPAGVGARSLRECLLLQVERLSGQGERLPEGIETVIRLSVGCGRTDLVGQLARKGGRRRTEVAEILKYIRSHLYPFPGYSYSAPEHIPAEARGYICPDVIVRQCGEDLSVELPVSQSRYLRLSQAYLELEWAWRELARRQDTEQEQQAREQLQKAREFLNMLRRRQEVIKLIAEAVVGRQARFILYGDMYHQSLSKKKIAEQTGLHETTVCRATRGKYAQLPAGEVVDFAVFFESAVPVKRIIAQMIRNEPPDHPLSDNNIARMLGERGYDVAKRTVAKYRTVLRIPGSPQRRQHCA